MKTPFWEVAFKCRRVSKKDQEKCKEKWIKGTDGPINVAKYILKNLDKTKFYFLPDKLSKISYYFLKHFYFISNFYRGNIMLPRIKRCLKKVNNREE